MNSPGTSFFSQTMHSTLSFYPFQAKIEVAWRLQSLPPCQANTHADYSLSIDLCFLLYQLSFPSQQEVMQRDSYIFPLSIPAMTATSSNRHNEMQHLVLQCQCLQACNTQAMRSCWVQLLITYSITSAPVAVGATAAQIVTNPNKCMSLQDI